MSSDTFRSLDDIQVTVDTEAELDEAQANDGDEEVANETESTLLTVAMFGGLVLFGAGCIMLGGMG